MNRREFSIQTAATLGAGSLLWSAPAGAQGGPVEGTHYVRLNEPAPVSAPAGKVEVVEFFWYGCPHCFHFEPFVEGWSSKLPADVAFRRVPVAFRERPFGVHQQLYFAIESMGLIDSLHPRVFKAMHEQQQRLDTPEAIAEFVGRNGVDSAKFMAVFKSFAVQTKCRQARSLTDAYRIDGVPALGIAGRYYTSISLNGTPARTLDTTNALIARSRRPA
ncbi:thiol:disulfide interchange protein DsbA/DsbL [Aquabacterium sp. A3]|uniref:thiol:disulfide interchange protein DsbA/DsbL n=1 Tax=Aquabacterium sp. A3 TaxID=3132829 RepID=UPI0031199E51